MAIGDLSGGRKRVAKNSGRCHFGVAVGERKRTEVTAAGGGGGAMTDAATDGRVRLRYIVCEFYRCEFIALVLAQMVLQTPSRTATVAIWRRSRPLPIMAHGPMLYYCPGQNVLCFAGYDCAQILNDECITGRELTPSDLNASWAICCVPISITGNPNWPNSDLFSKLSS